MTNHFYISEDNNIELNSPTLKEVFRVCEDLCEYLEVPYDPSKLIITTDYGTKVVIYYEGK